MKRAFYHLAAIVTAALVTLGVLWAVGKIHFPVSHGSTTQPSDPWNDPFWPPANPAPPPPPVQPPPVYR